YTTLFRSPQRLRVGDQFAEQAAALRPVVDPGDLRLVQADGDELDQPAALADDAERAVAGRHQFDRGLDDLPEDHLEFQVAADGNHGFEKRVRPVPGVENLLELHLRVAARHAMIVRRGPRMPGPGVPARTKVRSSDGRRSPGRMTRGPAARTRASAKLKAAKESSAGPRGPARCKEASRCAEGHSTRWPPWQAWCLPPCCWSRADC